MEALLRIYSLINRSVRGDEAKASAHGVFQSDLQ